MSAIDQRLAEIEGLRAAFDDSLILNPTENIPWEPPGGYEFVEGLYVPEEARDESSRVIFGGRNPIGEYMMSLYSDWVEALHAADASFKVYAGLHAHIVLFMSVAAIGDKVVLLPEEGGGHYATEKMLERLGLQIKTMPVDCEKLAVDAESTMALIREWEPDFVFVDRSDGLVYEDFSWLRDCDGCYRIFDASQYLTHILAGDYTNPFDMGADLILSTLHKNYPGPQKAAFFTRALDEHWADLRRGLSSYVSNTHSRQILNAVVMPLAERPIGLYSKTMLENSEALLSGLASRGVPCVARPQGGPPTQQIWIASDERADPFARYEALERLGLHVNHRQLPYNLGPGLRLGTAGATRQGLRPEQSDELAEIIAGVYSDAGDAGELEHKAHALISKIKEQALIEERRDRT